MRCFYLGDSAIRRASVLQHEVVSLRTLLEIPNESITLQDTPEYVLRSVAARIQHVVPETRQEEYPRAAHATKRTTATNPDGDR